VAIDTFGCHADRQGSKRATSITKSVRQLKTKLTGDALGLPERDKREKSCAF